MVVASVAGVVVVVASVVGVVVVVVMGRVICQSCDVRRGTELTYDGDDACCHHHLDNVAMPHCLPTRSAVGADDMALPCCCHLMVHVVLVVGS